jgi:hypothetical protein
VRTRRLRLASALAVLTVALATSSAEAATEIGRADGGIGICSGGGTYVQANTGAATPSYAVPAGGGVIVAWKVEATVVDEVVKLKVFRPTPMTDVFTVVGESEAFGLPGPGIQQFPAQIPVAAGDRIGFTTGATGFTGCILFTTDPADVRRLGGGDPPVGSQFMTGSAVPEQTLNIAATVEPDCDSDGLGDETQDPSLLGGDCPVRGRNVTLDANKHKVKKGKRVAFTGQLTELLGQGECQGAQAVELQRKKPSQTLFATVDQLQTTAAGNFSAKEKVKKTFEYRAAVAESTECEAAVSNTEKVKVKKRN